MKTVRRVACSIVVCLSLASIAHAAPSQSDVFKSIQDSMGQPTQFDARPVVMLLAGGALIFLLMMLGGRKNRKGTPLKNLNNPGKLVKEVLRELPLKSSEIKQLKLLAQAAGAAQQEELDALSLLLCPSLMAKGLASAPEKIDRKIVAQVVRKLKINSDQKAAGL